MATKLPSTAAPNMGFARPWMMFAFALALTCTSCTQDDNTDTGSAGEAGTACVPALQSGGCLRLPGASEKRMLCDPGSETWTQLAACGDDEKCVLDPDPGAPNSALKVANCISHFASDSAAADAGQKVDAGSDIGRRPVDASKGPPAVTWKIDHKPATSYTFPAEPARKTFVFVTVHNTGPVPVTINSVIWSAGGAHFTLEWAKFEPSSSHMLSPSAKLNASVYFNPDKAGPNPATATLAFGFATDGMASQALTFHPPTKSAIPGQACTATKSHILYNPTDAFGGNGCLHVRNCGAGPLTFKSASFKDMVGTWKLVSQPASGTELSAWGSKTNPVELPASFAVCYQLLVNGPKPAKATIRVETDDPKGALEFPISVKHLAVPQVPFKCSSGGAHRLAFKVGDGTLSCTLENQHFFNINVKSGALKALVPDNMSVVSQLYDVNFVKLPAAGGDGTAVTLPTQLMEHEQLRVDVKYIGGKAKNVPPARFQVEVDVEGVSHSVGAALWPPDCSVARLGIAPEVVPMALRAKPGQSSGQTFGLANLGCGNLQIKPACVTYIGGALGADACQSNKKSLVVSVPPAAADMAVKGDQVGKLFASMKVSSTMTTWQKHWLRIFWCTGTWLQGACSLGMHGQVHTIAARSDAGLLPQAPVLSQKGIGKAQRPVMITAAGGLDVWPMTDDQRWIWSLVARPEGSAFWLHKEQQATQIPVLIFTPDMPGNYAFQVRGRFAHPEKKGEVVWSKSAQLWVNVAK